MAFVARTSFNIISKVADDIERTGQQRVMQAARYVRKKIVESAKATYPKVTGDLYKGVAAEGREGAISQYNVRSGSSSTGKGYAVVGMTKPAYHAHLLEFGTKERVVKNAFGRKGVKMNVGRVKAKPFVEPVFEREAGAVQEILSGTWVK
jgi:HK97 gp10 family phage protein